METDKLKPCFTAVVKVKAINYQNGNVMEAKGEITKSAAECSQIKGEDTLTFRGGDCEKPQMEINYNSSAKGTDEQTTDVDLEIKGRVLTDRKELVDVIATDAKLKTVFGGKGQIELREDWLKLKIENSCDAKCANTESYYTHKTSEIHSCGV